MKPLAPASDLWVPVATGLASLPLLTEAPVWGIAGIVVSAGYAYLRWLKALQDRPPLPPLEGETQAPVDIEIAWRTPGGEIPAHRRGWQTILTSKDLWLCPVRPIAWLGGDRDHVRIARLDVVECQLVSESELRLRFLDDAGKAQDVRLRHLPNATALGLALGAEVPRDASRGL